MRRARLLTRAVALSAPRPPPPSQPPPPRSAGALSTRAPTDAVTSAWNKNVPVDSGRLSVEARSQRTR